ncbi:MAG: hypothetical protein ABWY19_17035 [Marmoricola sp.]
MSDRRFRLVAVAAVLALLLGLVGCGGDDDSGSDQVVGGSVGVDVAEARAQEQRILNQRARAVRERDLDLFLKRVDHSDRALVARQTRYFRNLVQLPLARFGYRVTTAEWEGQQIAKRWGDDVHIPQVRMTMQLRDYDAVPVERTVGFVFAFRDGRAVLVSDRSAQGEALYLGTPAPWDLTAIRVREEGGVLGVFDRRTESSADTVMSAVDEGISDLDRALPFSWPGQVVVYSVDSRRVLTSFRDVPGGAIEHLGAMTFPTYAEDRHSQVASTRMLLMPTSVRAGQPFLGRITRHELSHVAIGVRDDGSPTWVSEGIAEYLGAREVPVRERIIPTAALQRAASVDATLPGSKDFNNSDQEWHYALSWMACDYIAETFGEARLWELVDAMHNGGVGTPDTDQDRVLEQVLGFDGHELALRAAARIRNIYG